MNILELKRKLLPMSGPQQSGGGGGSGTGTQTQISELPEWARGYAKSTLEKGAALTEKPYQAYGGDRIAGFSPLQQQSQQGAANMQTNAATGAGINVAGQAAMQGLNQDYNGMMARSQNFGGRQAAQYMSPYMEQAVAPQLREAQRSSDIQAQQNAARAVGQGAFGGSRAALVEAERQRNLGTQMGDIRAKGLQDAYSQAQQQFNADQARGLQAQQMNIGQQQFGANLGLQGLNTALQGASTLGQLGGQQFQQGMDINKLQNAYGGQQQALQQQGLTQAYEDFQNQQNYPYKQLGFFSDLIRGLPLGQQTATQMYTPNPSTAQQVGALGMGAYGLSKFMAEGGMAYADGGSVDSPDNVERIVSKLSDEQLQQAMQAAQARGDQDQLEAIQSEMAMRASERNGLASAVTPQMADRFAGGGILAFAGDEDENDPVSGQLVTGAPNQAALKEWLAAQEELKNFKASPALTKEDRAAMDKENFERFQKFAGEDPYAPMAERLKTFETDRAKALEEGKGLAALQAIPAILQGGNAARGIGAGIGALGGNLAQVAKADAAEKRALASMDFNLKDAQRKERMGLTKEAINATTDAQKDRIAADKAQLEALKARAKGATDAGRAFRTTGGGAGGGSKDFIVGPAAYAAALREQHKDWSEAQINAEAFRLFQAGKSAGLQGATEKVDVAVATGAEKSWNDMSRKEKKAWALENDIDTTNPAWISAAKKNYVQDFASRAKPAPAPRAEPKDEPTPKPTPKPTAQKTAKVQGMPEGATLGKTTKQGVEVLDANGKLIGYAK